MCIDTRITSSRAGLRLRRPRRRKLFPSFFSRSSPSGFSVYAHNLVQLARLDADIEAPASLSRPELRKPLLDTLDPPRTPPRSFRYSRGYSAGSIASIVFVSVSLFPSLAGLR